MNRLKGAVLAAALAFAYAGAAAADDETGFYAGVGLGQSTIEDDAVAVADFDEDDTGFKVFGGYQFNKYLAAEAAVVDFGSPDTSIGVFDVEEEAAQLNVSAVGTLPINDYFGVMGRLGVAYTEGEARVKVGGDTVADDDDDSTDLSYGLGVWAAPTKNLLVRLEYEMTSAELGGTDVDLSLLSLSAVYKFGK